MLKPIFRNTQILAVDDEPDNLNVVQQLLTYLGAEVLTARDGSQGLQEALAHTPDLIVTDLSMPEMNGWELLQQLQENDSTKDIPVIAVTAHAMAGDREKVLNAGFANYISKPIDILRIVPQLTQILKDIPSLVDKIID